MGSTSENSHVDRRVRKTKIALTDALMALLSEKSLKDITVIELTQKADVNRATFYLHYNGIYDMVDKLKREIAEFLSALITDHFPEISVGDPYPAMLELYRYFSENKSLYSLVFGENGDLSFVDTMTDVIRSRYFDVVAAAQDSGYTLSTDEHIVGFYQYNFVAAGVASMIKHWLEVDRAETPEEMAMLTSAFLRQNSHGLNEEALEAFQNARKNQA